MTRMKNDAYKTPSTHWQTVNWMETNTHTHTHIYMFYLAHAQIHRHTTDTNHFRTNLITDLTLVFGQDRE